MVLTARPWMVLPAMFLFEFSSSCSSVARNLAFVQLVCDGGAFAAGVACDSADVGQRVARFNLRYSLAAYVPAFFISVHIGRMGDRGSRWLPLLLPVLGHVVFAAGMVAVQLGRP